MSAEFFSFCNEILAALLVGVAQGLVIVALVWAALKLLRGANAATRHATWLVTLFVVAALPMANFVIPRFATLASSPPAAVEPTQPLGADLSAWETPFPSSSPEVAVHETFEVISQPLADQFHASGGANWQIHAPRSLSAIILAVLVTLATIRLACLCAQLIALRRIKKRSASAGELALGVFAHMHDEARLDRTPALLTAPLISAPMVVGFVRPAVLLPTAIAAEASAPQLENIFRHELAHLSRRDDWANLAQQLIAAILFFHPGVAFVSRRLSIEREIACDDHALAAGRTRRDYALFLTEFAGRMKGRGFTAAPAAWSSNSQLKERISMILDGKRNASPRVSRTKVGVVAAATLSLAVFAMAVSPRLVLAAGEPAETTADDVKVEAVVAPPEVDVQVAVADVAQVAPTVVITAPREKGDRVHASIFAPPPPVGIAPSAAIPPRPAKVAAAHSDVKDDPAPPAKQPRDESLERRLDRLERMVESLGGREKGEKQFRNEKTEKHNFEFKHDFMGPEFKADMDHVQREVQREVQRAQREVERARRDVNVNEIKKQAMADANRNSSQMRIQIDGDRQSIKARRQALEAQRKAIEKQLEALDKQMDEERANEKQSERRNKNENKSEEKSEKKKRDTGEKSESDDVFQKR